jgi:hypothetical protein
MTNNPEMPELAIKNLQEYQKQLDMDGVMVGVSRQALDEVLAYVTRPAAAHSEELRRVGELIEEILYSHDASHKGDEGYNVGNWRINLNMCADKIFAILKKIEGEK